MRASNIDPGAKRPRRAIYDARFAQARSRAVVQPRTALPPAAIPAPVERQIAAARPRRGAEWPQWIAAAVGSAALVAAGYLGALVQLGASQPQALSPGLQPAAPLPQPKLETRAMSATVGFPAAAMVFNEPARVVVPARRPKTHRVDVEAAARATAELERERYGHAAAAGRVQPNRQEVQQALLGLRPQIAACAAGRGGMVDARVGIAGTGRVTRALIQGDFAGTPEGSCMARALRAATIAPFSGSVVRVQFPFAL